MDGSVPLADQIVPLRPDLLLRGRQALMAALRRWWRKWRDGRWLHDEVEKFLRRRAQGQAAAPTAGVTE
eukprot:13179774-Alexandrium_andersonii.AAC.1